MHSERYEKKGTLMERGKKKEAFGRERLKMKMMKKKLDKIRK